MRAFTLFSAFVILSACADGGTVDPVLNATSARANARPDGACVGPATVTVRDETQLHTAIAKATRGAVIAISGTIALTREAEVLVADVTLTCERPGAGLTSRKPVTELGDLVHVFAPRVTIQGLVLDASALRGGAVYAVRSTGLGLEGRATRMVGNDVLCGGICLFFVGVDSAEVSDNHFLTEKPTTGTGIHMQRTVTGTGDFMIDGTRIERNTLVATVKTGSLVFGALRPRDGKDVVVRDNVVIGPWSNSLATANLHGSVIQGNRFEGAHQYALFVGANPMATPPSNGLLVRRNELTSNGKHAVFLNHACGNVLVANRIAAPLGASDVLLSQATGDNMLLGQPTESIDNGKLDCDRDGAADPNFLSGGGRQGAEPGDVIGPVMSHGSHVIQQ